MTRIFVFPGQGAQAVGMGRTLFDGAAEARHVFEEVDEALGEALSRVVFDGPESTLTLTENAQPALMAVSLAAVRVLEARAGRPFGELAGMVAGHSLGEYSALAAAGALSIGDAARLLRLRGRAMQAAVPVGTGAMAAILGLELDAVEEVARIAAASEVCDVANDNAPGQVVVSGHRTAVERAVALAKERGAKRSMLLQVSAPFHCALMAPAAETLAAALATIRFRAPVVPLIANVTAAQVDDPADLRGLLTEQVTARVRWRESLATMRIAGAEMLVEVGAGKVLSGLARRALPDIPSTALQTPSDIDGFVAALDDTSSR